MQTGIVEKQIRTRYLANAKFVFAACVDILRSSSELKSLSKKSYVVRTYAPIQSRDNRKPYCGRCKKIILNNCKGKQENKFFF